MKKTLSLLAATLACLGSPLAQAQVNGDLSTWTCVGTCGASAADGDITLSPTGNSQYAYLSTNGSAAHNVSPLNFSESGGGGSTFFQTNGSRYTSATFTLGANQTVDAWFNYVSTDGKGFDDYAWARLVNAGDSSTAAWMFTARSTNGSKQNVVPGNALAKADDLLGFDPDAVIVNYKDFDFNTRTTQSSAFNPINWSKLGEWNGTCWRDNAEGCGFTGWLHSALTPGAGSYRLEVGVVNFGDEAWDSGIAFDVTSLTAAVPEPTTWALMLAGVALLATRRRQH
ncbi:PEP-CTERM putative exosortase interaction domain-containing protein [Burkholderiales bacterium JOSHI_001]|nr:PEP-CTERM putative exosortase interaction domain-containing protein [Burkholderiales bacterium JOSHI_001]